MIETFFIQLLLTFLLIIVSATIITISKKREAKAKHSLTGMCHKTGGTVCSSCQSAAKIGRKKQAPLQTESLS